MSKICNWLHEKGDKQPDMETKTEDDNFRKMIAKKLKTLRQGAIKESLKL